MKSILVRDDPRTGSTTLASPLAKLGVQSDLTIVKKICGVPDDFMLEQLVALWNQTYDLTWLLAGNDPTKSGRNTFHFSELGINKVITR